MAVTQNKSLNIVKDADVASVDGTDDVIHYTIAVTNTGNAAIAGVMVDDPFTTDEAPVLSAASMLATPISDGLLDVTETWQYTASHQVTQAELDAGGGLDNAATASGDGAAPDSDDASVR